MKVRISDVSHSVTGGLVAVAGASKAITRLHAAGKINATTDIALSEYLLEKAGVAVVPGSAFGSEGYIRLSFATSMDNLKSALSRLQTWMA